MAKHAEQHLPADSSDGLNPQQRAVVEHGEGPLLVVAGAGTGKTRVITQRIRRLLETQPGLAGENILALTFTNKAANEMKARVVGAVGERAKGVWLSTFHKFCLERILQGSNAALRVVEDAEHWILLRRNISRIGLRVFKRLADPGLFLTDFVKFFSRCQDEMVTAEEYDSYVAGLRAKLENEKGSLDAETRALREQDAAKQEEVARAYRVSDRLLRERNLCTFGMQILEAVRLLQADAELLARLREQYRYILVDEFQDTNIAQIELLGLLAGPRVNLLAVGDDDQAIYRFRGASFGSFQLFAEKFIGKRIDPGQPPPQVHVLRDNYRSTQRILRVAGQSIGMNRDRMFPEKELTTEHPVGEALRVVEFGDKEAEAHWVAAELARLHGEGRPWAECAALYRSHTHRDALVEELRGRGIPFVIKNISIFTHRLVRDLVAWLRWIAFPGDDVAGARVLACPAWGLEAAGVVRLCQRARRARGLSLWDALQSAQGEPGFGGDTRRRGEMTALVTELRVRAKKLSAAEMFDALVAELGLVLVAEDPARRYVSRFAEFVREFERSALAETRSLVEFLQYLELFEEAGGKVDLSEVPDEDAVQLMTIHAAKGLEFGHVFLLRLVAGQFPVRPRKRVLEFPVELMKEEKPQGEFQIQEERRLFYVALTRAKRRLTLTTVANKRSKPSPFLDDVLLGETRKGDVQRLAPKESDGGGPGGAASPPRRAPTAGPAQLFGPGEPAPRAYSRIAEWAAEYRPPVGRPLELSATAIETYDRCAQKYLFHSGWEVRSGPHAATTFGFVMHATVKFVVAELAQGRALRFEDVESYYEREWFSAGFEDDYQEEEYKKDGLEQLRAFHEACVNAPPAMVDQEKFFQMAIEDDVVLTGRMDQVNRLGAGEAEIVDYKTGRPRDASDARKNLQLSVYALAAREELALEPAKLTIYNLTTNEAVTTARDEKALNKARGKILEVAAGIRAGKFPANPGYFCRGCDYRLICPAHEMAARVFDANNA